MNLCASRALHSNSGYFLLDAPATLKSNFNDLCFMDKTSQNHWNTVYKTKNPDQVSWTQEVPKTSLDFIHSFGLTKTAKIIDVGGGDSKLVDYLLDEGFENITVLDISVQALDKAKNVWATKPKK